MFTEISCAQNEYASQIQRSRIRYPCRKRVDIMDPLTQLCVGSDCSLGVLLYPYIQG